MEETFGKLWLYTNLNCNLACSYCVAESSPEAAPRELGLATIRRLVDEAVELGIQQIFLTGGEPFLLEEIYAMLEYASARAETVVLTNGLLLRGRRLERLSAVANEQLVVQVSLDGARPEHHDPYRGEGTWRPTVDAIQRLQERDIHVRLSTTETAANAHHLDELAAFRHSLGIVAADHVVRPLARRGFSTTGIEVEVDTLAPELTVNTEGVFWHPLASPSALDMKVSDRLDLRAAVSLIRLQLEQHGSLHEGRSQTVT
jgi:MoaA/NifB/PqqE/SkfB family radical SAM enzyme